MNAAETALRRLLDVMARLRDPETGCPWDRDQTHASLARYALEETYEVIEAIDRGDDEEMRDELGDLLLQIVFHARVAEERGAFDFAEITDAIADKMVRRHPHIFADVAYGDRASQEADWERRKAEERAAKANGITPSALDDVPRAFPALMRAAKLQKRAARVGFDWPAHDAEGPVQKVREELNEVLGAETDAERMEEIGDLLFSVVNLARRSGIEPETALRAANAKFERRFRHVEDQTRKNGADLAKLPLDALDAMWGRAKAEEQGVRPGPTPQQANLSSQPRPQTAPPERRGEGVPNPRATR